MSHGLARDLAGPTGEATYAHRLEPVPSYLSDWLSDQGIPPEGVKFVVSSDLDTEGHSSKTWVVLTDKDLYVIPERRGAFLREVTRSKGIFSRNTGSGSGEIDRELVRTSPLARIAEIRVENLMGNGLLVAQVGEAPEPVDSILCRFSNSSARKFGLFSRLAEKVRKSESSQDGIYRCEHESFTSEGA